jgi:hypothetical protein
MSLYVALNMFLRSSDVNYIICCNVLFVLLGYDDIVFHCTLLKLRES